MNNNNWLVEVFQAREKSKQHKHEHLLSIIDGIVGEHFTILSVRFIWILDFDYTARWIDLDNLLVVAGLLFFAHRTTSHHNLYAFVLHLYMEIDRGERKKRTQ